MRNVFQNVFQKWKKRADVVGRRDGISMAIVICIGALLLAFSLAMAYTGSLMMASANTRLEEERTYQLAKSFAEALDSEIKDTSSDFYDFAYNFIGSSIYRDYDEDNANNTVYTYSLPSSELTENYGSVTIKMYKELIYENTKTVLSGAGSDSSTAYRTTLQTEEQTPRNRYDLTVVVVASYGDSEYAYKTTYSCVEYLKLKLTDTDGKSLYYRSLADPFGSTTDEIYYTIYTDQSYSSPYTGTGIYYTLRTDSEGVFSRSFTQETPEKEADTGSSE